LVNDLIECRLCGDRSVLRPTGRIINGYGLSTCSSCGCVMAEMKPAAEEIVRIYDSLFTDGGYAQHRAEFELIKSGKVPQSFYRRLLLKRIEAMCSGRTLIEIGGGTGAFGVLAKSRGWDYTNYDISPAAVGFCQQLSLRASVFHFGDVPPLRPASADAVVMWEVVEHIWNLHEYMRVVRNALKPDGLLLFSTPNYLKPSCHESDTWGPLAAPPIHVNFFTKETMQHVLGRGGFTASTVFKRRIYMPKWSLVGVVRSLRLGLGVDEPETLCGIARSKP
jgi:SAM-dependent methyltransferase